MKQATICLILVLASLRGHLALKYSSRQVCDPSPSNQTIYDFSLDDVYQNDTIDFSAYRGKLVLLVNTATYCGHVGQYIGLNALQEEHGDEGLQVIGVPCNQFAMKEPAWNGVELMTALKYIRPGNGFVPNFPLSWIQDVNGDGENPLYTYLKPLCPPVESHITQPILYNGVYIEDVRWNYEKFLIGPDGRPLYRYAYNIDPATNEQFKNDVVAELAKMKSSSAEIMG